MPKKGSSTRIIEEGGIKYKICNKGPACIDENGPKLPIEKFSKRKVSPDGHTYTCKACEKEAARENYHKRKKEGKLELTGDEKEMRKQFYRDYYRANKDRKKKYDKKYMNTEQGRKAMREGQKRRRDRIKEQAGEKYEKWQVYAKDTDEDGVLKCRICKKVIERIRDAHTDHIIPIGEGGKDELENVRTVCVDCNLQRPKSGSDAK